jgi:hypothetical protein
VAASKACASRRWPRFARCSNANRRICSNTGAARSDESAGKPACARASRGHGRVASWKHEALWDGYVVTLENTGEQPVTINFAALSDSAGVSYASGSDPWALEKQSKKLEKQYRNGGEAFIRAAGPGVLIVGAGAATVSAAAGSSVIISAGVAGAAAATIIVLPVYYSAVLGINHHNKKAVMAEFNRRQLPLPLTLAPGEVRSSSFYPMVRSPGSLALEWSTETGRATATLPFDFTHALHMPAVPADQAGRQFPSGTQ